MQDDDTNTTHHMQIYSLIDASPEHRSNLFDFTEQKLLRFEKLLRDEKQKVALYDLIKKYKEGMIAIGWSHGSPLWTTLRRES